MQNFLLIILCTLVLIVSRTDLQAQTGEGNPDQSESAWMAKTRNRSFPDFTLTDMNGNTITKQGLKGKVVVFNFWLVGCGECVKEIPELNALKQKYERQGVVFLAVTEDDKNAVTKFSKKKNFNYTLIPDALSLSDALELPVYPAHIILDSKGEIKEALIGGREALSSVEQAITAQLR